MKLRDLAAHLGARIEKGSEGTPDVEISRVMGIEDADSTSVTFISNPKYIDKLRTTRAAAVMTDARVLELHAAEFPCPALVVENAYVAFAQTLQLIHPAPTHEPGISPLAFIHPGAAVHPSATVMPFAYVGKATIGAGTVIYPHCFLDDGVSVGERCTLYPHVILMRGTRVANDVVFQPSAVLGSDGFGYAQDATGMNRKIPQVGNVEVGDDVEIGAFTAIDRAALGTTKIGANTKIDNLVQIAHNVVIGNSVVVCGHAAIAGSSKLEDNVMVGGSSGVGGHMTMHKGSKLSGGSFVMHDIPAGEQWMGMPAMPNSKRFRTEIHYRNLDDHVKLLKQLQKRVTALEAQLKAAGEPKP